MLPCGCHLAIYLLAPQRNPTEGLSAEWHPGRGARFLARVSEGRSPDDPGLRRVSIPATPPGCRTDGLTGKCDALAGSYIFKSAFLPGVIGTSCLDRRAKNDDPSGAVPLRDQQAVRRSKRCVSLSRKAQMRHPCPDVTPLSIRVIIYQGVFIREAPTRGASLHGHRSSEKR